jgi:multiple sugar transport system permease protein
MAVVSQTLTRKSNKAARTRMSPAARREARWGLFFLTPWIIGFLLFSLLPMIASLGFSLFDFNPAVPDQARFIGLNNWRRALFEDPEVWRSFSRTLRFGLITLPMGLGFALYLAVLLNSTHTLGKDLLRTMFYMPAVIPLVASVLIWAGVLNEQTGWFNVFIERVLGIPAIGVTGIRWLNDPGLIYYTYAIIGLYGVGNTMLIFLAGLQSVPTEMYEAAEIDGASWLARLLRITLPLISPIIFYNLILGFIGLLQYFLVPLILSDGTGRPEGMTRFIMVYFYRQSFGFFSMGYGATLAWLLFLVALAVTLILFGTARYWVHYSSEEA